MPQKKNPHALERVKAAAGQAIGWLPTVMGCQRGVSSTDLDLAFGDDWSPGYEDAADGALRLLAEAIRTLTVHADVMAAKAGAFWSTASHLADELVRRHDLPFRTAHHVVARFVRDAVARHQGPADAAPELLAEALRELAGIDVVVTEPISAAPGSPPLRGDPGHRGERQPAPGPGPRDAGRGRARGPRPSARRPRRPRGARHRRAVRAGPGLGGGRAP